MPDVRMPDGTIIRNVPEGTTKAQLQARVAKAGQAKDTRPDRSWIGAVGEGITNIPSSAGNFAKGVAQAIINPLDTAGAVLDLGAGALQNAVPKGLADLINRVDPNPQAASRARETAAVAGAFLKDRYGSTRGIKNTLATDPVGMAADISAVLSGGAALASKAPRLAGALRTGAKYTNPINAATKAAKAVVKPAAKVAANTIGAFGTHTGGAPIQEVARAGYRGGQAQADAIANMRGKVPMTDVLDAAKQNLAAMSEAKAANYRTNMAGVSGDNTVLSFGGVDKALKEAKGLTEYKGQVKNAKAAAAVRAINNEITNWKKLNPSEFHTPEGLDALKQKVGAIQESIPFEEKTARLAVGKIYNSIKGEISKQAPTYSKTMKDYSSASDQISEIEKALSLGNKASVDTAMRKLQSLTRNNVNTNYGNRMTLAQELERQGGQSLMPSLSGQALNTWVPRGLGGTVAGGVGLGGYAAGGWPLAATALALQSPRLVGEAALKAGQAARTAKIPGEMLLKQGINPAVLANYLAVMNQNAKAKEKEDSRIVLGDYAFSDEDLGM